MPRVCLGVDGRCPDGAMVTSGSRCPRCRAVIGRRRGKTSERMGSGWASISRRVLKRDGYECQLRLPGCEGRATTADHVVRRRDGGDSSPQNLQAACRHCNSTRG